MLEVARQIGYDVKTLRKVFPSPCIQISLRFMTHRKKLTESARRDFFNEVLFAVSHFHSLGKPIANKSVAEFINKPTYKIGTRLRGPISEAKHQLGII